MTVLSSPQKCELVLNIRDAPITDDIKPQRLIIKWMLRDDDLSVQVELYGPEVGGKNFWRKRFYNVANTANRPLPGWTVEIVQKEMLRVRTMFQENNL